MAKIIKKATDRWVGKKVKCKNCRTYFKIEKNDRVNLKKIKDWDDGPDPRHEGPVRLNYEVFATKCPECKKEVILSKKLI